MNKAFVVARWEYLEKVKSKAFLIGLFLTPVIMIAMGVLPTFFASQEDEESRTIAIVAPNDAVAPEFASRMQSEYKLGNGRPNYVVLPMIVPRGGDVASIEADALQRVGRGELEGFAVLRDGDSTVEYRSKVVGDFRIGARIEETLRGIMAEHPPSDRRTAECAYGEDLREG
jgi:ABC-2 type transport system permease protein